MKLSLSLFRALFLGAFGIAFLMPPAACAQQTYRTVIDKEVGSLYEHPRGNDWTQYGAFVGSASTLDPAAIRVVMSHFDKFTAWEEQYSWGIPYSKLRAYEADQVRQGKPPIFVTATYQGKARPVLFSWSLVLVNGKPTAPPDQWQYAVNVQDSRFIHFWINQYIQPLIATHQNVPHLGPNLWIQLDQCALQYSLFGVLDDSDTFVAGVPWDAPFPRNQSEYEAGIATFFGQVKQLAPNINVDANLGSQSDPSHFPQLFGTISGAIFEDLYQFHSGNNSLIRNDWYNQSFQYFSWVAAHNRAGLMRAIIPAGDSQALLTSFSLYSLLKGANFFFAPGDNQGYTLDPALWAGMKAQLGSPLGDLQSSAPSSGGVGHRLFWRLYEGGTVYLNWTGSPQTIELDNQHTYYGPNGQRLTQLQVPDGVGTYVTVTPNALPAPRLSPRYGAPVITPVPVTIENLTPGSTIHYTVDGTTPTLSSPVYNGPIQLDSGAVVQARSFLGGASSWSSTASYSVPSEPLTVQFHIPSDSGPRGPYYPVVTLSAIPNETVHVAYTVTNGSPETGSYTLLPGQIYGILPVTTSSSGTTTVTLASASGAAVGQISTFEYNPVNQGGHVTVGIGIAPAKATVATSGQQLFTATVTNAKDPAVTWSVDGIPGGGSAVGTVQGGLYTGPAVPGLHTVTATSVQDPSKYASAPINITLATPTATAPDFSLGSSPATAVIHAGQSRQFTVTVSPVGGFNQQISFSLSGCPTNAACTVSPNSLTLDGTHSGSVVLTVSTTARPQPNRATAPPPGLFGNGTMLLAYSILFVWPFAGIGLGRSHSLRIRSSALALSVLAVSVLAMSLLTSCAGLSSSRTGNAGASQPAPASYNVTATGTAGTLSRSTTVALTVN